MLTLPANPDTAFGGVSQGCVTGKLANTPRQGPPVRFFIFYGPPAIPEVSRLDRQDEMQARGVICVGIQFPLLLAYCLMTIVHILPLNFWPFNLLTSIAINRLLQDTLPLPKKNFGVALSAAVRPSAPMRGQTWHLGHWAAGGPYRSPMSLKLSCWFMQVSG